MKKKTLTRDTLEEILDDAVLDAEDVVYNWPSGMYGEHDSFALTADDTQLAHFFIALGSLITIAPYENPPRTYPEGLANLAELLPSGTDTLGRGTVTYFRGWELEPEG